MIDRPSLALALVVWSSSTVQAEPVQDYVGKQIGIASAQIEEFGWTLLGEAVASNAPIGQILAQAPEPGVDIPSGSTFFLRWSDGLEAPDLVGRQIEDAESITSSLGLAVEKTFSPQLGIQAGVVDKLRIASSLGLAVEKTFSPQLGIQAGVVASQVPKPGDKIDASKQVMFLTLSSDPGIAIPDVSGLLLGDAISTLAAIGLVGTPTPANPVGYRSGGGLCAPIYSYTHTVTSFSPGANTRVWSGQVVSLSYSTKSQMLHPGGPCTKEGVPY